MRYSLLIDDRDDVAKIERFLSEARNLRIDIDIPEIGIQTTVEKTPSIINEANLVPQPTIMFSDQGQGVSYFVRAELEEGDIATASDGSRWP